MLFRIAVLWGVDWESQTLTYYGQTKFSFFNLWQNTFQSTGDVLSLKRKNLKAFCKAVKYSPWWYKCSHLPFTFLSNFFCFIFSRFFCRTSLASSNASWLPQTSRALFSIYNTESIFKLVVIQRYKMLELLSPQAPKNDLNTIL